MFRFFNKKKLSVITLAPLLLIGCQTNYVKLDIKPKTAPVYNMTRTSVVLSCIGEKINSMDVQPIDIFITDIPDHTIPSIESGFLTKNSVMMATTAVDRLGTSKVAVVGRNGGLKNRLQVQILGSFTELNRTTKSSALSSKTALPGGFTFDFGGDKSVNHLAVDLAMSVNNRILPSTATSLSIKVNTQSGNTTLTYDDGGDFATVGALGFSAQEGFHSAQRLVVETAIALMVSKFYKIDMKECLNGGFNQYDPKGIDKPIYIDNAKKVPYQSRPSYKNYESKKEIVKKPIYTLENQNSLGKRNATQEFSTKQNSYSISPPQEDVVILPRTGRKNTRKIITEKPPEYTNKNNKGSYSGSDSINSEDFIVEY